MSRPRLSRDTALNIYMPSGARQLGIAPGSAIVGLPEDGGMIEAYFEGAVYGQRMSFEEKLQLAGGRMVDRAPTTAFGFYHEEDLVLIGRCARSARLVGWIVTEAVDKDALDRWSGETITIGGSQELRNRAAGIAFGDLPPDVQQEIQARGRAGEDVVELVLSRI